MSVYEDREVLSQYLLFHYGNCSDLFPYDFAPKHALEFPKRCVTELVDFKGQKALDLGCSVGRSSFELTKHFDSVTGIDFSQAFIDAANEIKVKKSLDIKIQKEGSLNEDIKVSLPEDIFTDKVNFLKGDAQDISEEYFDNDLVLACNLLCRLPRPEEFLNTLKKLVKKNGKLVLVSPYSWLEQFTDKENWLSKNSTTASTEEEIQSILKGDFTLTNKKEMPFLIREHKRKFQLGVSQALVFIRS